MVSVVLSVLISREITTVWLPSAIPSATPVTVTFCGVAQSNSSKVRKVLSTAASVESRGVMSITTMCPVLGLVFRFNVKNESAPSSMVTPLAGVRVTPIALSLLITATSGGLRLRYPLVSEAVPAALMVRAIVTVWLPSAKASLCPVRVTVWGENQSEVVKVN